MKNLIGKLAPSFEAPAIVDGKIEEKFSLANYQGNYVLFFFYPLDFTFVCPTELHAFESIRPKFEERGAHIVACSVDSIHSHNAWLHTPKKQGGIEGIHYPLVSDIHKEISRNFGVLNEEEGIAFRGLFLLDKEGIIRHSLINDLPLGRSCEEALRMLDSLIFFEQNGEVCPANWQNGDRSMLPSREGVANYFSEEVHA